MKFAGVIATAAALISSVFAEDKNAEACGPCHCPANQIEQIVRGLQTQFNENAQRCDYRANMEMSTPDASILSIDYACLEGCCATLGTEGTWWAAYTCQDQLYYPPETWSVTQLPNGTVLVSLTEVSTSHVGGDEYDSSYMITYYWNPVFGSRCQYKMAYIKAHAANCPTSMPNLCTVGC